MLEFFVAQESPLWCQDQVDHFGSGPNFSREKKRVKFMEEETNDTHFIWKKELTTQ